MIIETERLILRPFVEDDAEDVYEYLNEPAVHCFACMKLESLANAREEVKRRTGETEYYFAITLKDTGKVIGEIDAYPETGEPHSSDDTPKDTFSPCWMLNKKFQGKGYAYEAAYAFFNYLFRDKGARRIYAYTEDYNLPSQHLCEKLGMRREGLFMEFVSFVNNPDGTPIYENTMQYAILKKEWLKGTSGDMTLQNSSDKSEKSKAELLGVLHEAEEDAKSGKVAPIKETFDGIRNRLEDGR